MALSVAADLAFGIGGYEAVDRTLGWSMPEAGFQWLTGGSSRLALPLPAGASAMALELSLVPLLCAPVLEQQRLRVLANGVPIGAVDVRREATVAFILPPSCLHGHQVLELTFEHPDAAAPADLGMNDDRRQLALAMRRLRLLQMPPQRDGPMLQRGPLRFASNEEMAEAVRFCTALTVPGLMQQFESLGTNCEFGIVQRLAGAEPLGLLRFGGIPLAGLLRGLEHGFAGVGTADNLSVFDGVLNGRQEYLVRDAAYGAEFHTNLFDGVLAAAEVAPKMARHLDMLRRHFTGAMEDASRIFVVHAPGMAAQADALPVLNRLLAWGPNALLYVTADTAQAPGSVVQERPGLFHGFIDRLVPMHEAERINAGAWISLCAHTYRLWRESGGG